MKTKIISGNRGRLTLNDNSYIEFESWTIYEEIRGQSEPGLGEWSGTLNFQESDYGKLNSLWGGEPINADFFGDENYSGKITIDDGPNPISFSVHFVAGSQLQRTPDQ